MRACECAFVCASEWAHVSASLYLRVCECECMCECMHDLGRIVRRTRKWVASYINVVLTYTFTYTVGRRVRVKEEQRGGRRGLPKVKLEQ